MRFTWNIWIHLEAAIFAVSAAISFSGIVETADEAPESKIIRPQQLENFSRLRPIDISARKYRFQNLSLPYR